MALQHLKESSRGLLSGGEFSLCALSWDLGCCVGRKRRGQPFLQENLYSASHLSQLTTSGLEPAGSATTPSPAPGAGLKPGPGSQHPEKSVRLNVVKNLFLEQLEEQRGQHWWANIPIDLSDLTPDGEAAHLHLI